MPFQTIELTPELLEQCIVDQNVPTLIFEQAAAQSRIELTAKDFYHQGGFLHLNGWSVEPAYPSGAPQDARSIGWVVQWELAGWIRPETWQPRVRGEDLDKKTMVRFSMKMQRQTYLFNEMTPAEDTILGHYYDQQMSGANLAVSLTIRPEFRMQFELRPYQTKVMSQGQKVDAIRLLGTSVSMEGFSFRSPLSGRGEFRVPIKRDVPLLDAASLTEKLLRRKVGSAAPAPAFSAGGANLVAQQAVTEEPLF